MIYEIQMPQEGMSMSDGDIETWLVKVGDTVEKGQEIVEVESAKASFPVCTPFAGKVVELLFEEGDNVPVGDVIAKIEG